MKKAFRIIGCFVWVLLLTRGIYAQVDIQLNMAADTFRMGQDIELSISMQPEDGIQISSFEIEVFDSLGMIKYLFPEDTTLQLQDVQPVDFEISDYGDLDETGTNQLGDGTSPLPQAKDGMVVTAISLKIWDPGNFILLVGKLSLISPDRKTQEFYPEIQHAKIVSIVGPDELAEGDIEIRPIKDILREGWHWLDFKWLYITVLAIALIMFILSRPKRIKKKKEKKEQKIIIKRPAHEVALEKLEVLRKSAKWREGDIKGFQTDLSFIVREYLENRFNIHALESTTREIVTSLDTKMLVDADIQTLRDLLQIADLVKFAKAKPNDDIHEQFLDSAVGFVEKTKRTEENTIVTS